MENNVYKFLWGMDHFTFPCKDYFSPEILVAERQAQNFTWKEVWAALYKDDTPMVLMIADPKVLHHPNKQEGRDFAMLLSGLASLDYSVQWRVIQLANKGPSLCIFAYKNNSAYGKYINNIPGETTLLKEGFLAKLFGCPHDKIESISEKELNYKMIPTLFSSFTFHFEDVGLMIQGKIVTSKIAGDSSKLIEGSMKQLIEDFMD